MNDQAGKVLIVEADETLKSTLAALLTDAGYEVSTDIRGGMQAVLTFGPDLVLLGADPPQLDCCDLLSEIKASKSTRNIRVVMLAHGSSAERTRGLDLGADDVLSLPLDPPELLSRIRTQLHNKQVDDELTERLRAIQETSSTNQQVVTAVKEERRTLFYGAVVVVFVLLIVAIVTIAVGHHSHAENVRVYAAITRLQTNALSQQALMERARQNLANPAPTPAVPAGLHQSAPIAAAERSRIPAVQTSDAPDLKTQFATVEGRLQKLENEQDFAHTIINTYEPSVCLIHVVLAFRDNDTGLRLHYQAVNADGDPQTDDSNNPLLSLTGSGPEVHLDVFGTGFLASDNGHILTNHHVVEPWWQNDDIQVMLNNGLKPEILEMTAYFPGVPRGIPITTQKISTAADVALVKANISGLGLKPIALAETRSASVGNPIVLLGYPTGVNAILARTQPATLQKIADSSKGDSTKVMDDLARYHLIAPVATQGHIGEVLPDKIVYDAQTTNGGSGGPLFNDQGQVIGINFAVVRDFGGSNFAIPVHFGESLLKP